MLNSVIVDKTDNDARRFTIFEKGERTQQLANLTMADGEVFTIVEEAATPVGGFPVYYSYVAANLKYPLMARQNGIEGKVFIEFVITKDGNIADVKPVKGIGGGCDEEAVRVVLGSAKWNPGKQGGVAVNQRMVLPITFNMNNGNNNTATITIDKVTEKNSEFAIEVSSQKHDGKMKLTGTVKDTNGNPIVGMNIVLRGTTSGTVSTLGGKFVFESDVNNGELVFSFVGYNAKSISF